MCKCSGLWSAEAFPKLQGQEQGGEARALLLNTSPVVFPLSASGSDLLLHHSRTKAQASHGKSYLDISACILEALRPARANRNLSIQGFLYPELRFHLPQAEFKQQKINRTASPQNFPTDFDLLREKQRSSGCWDL